MAITGKAIEKTLASFITKRLSGFSINEKDIEAATAAIMENYMFVYTNVLDQGYGARKFVVGNLVKRGVQKPVFEAYVYRDIDPEEMEAINKEIKKWKKQKKQLSQSRTK